MRFPLMKHCSRRSPDSSKSWAYIIYARVLLQMVEDLERPGTPEQAVALQWFTEDLENVALVCAACSVNPINVYRQVRSRLRAARIKSARVTLIRWHLRRGNRLHDVQ